MQVKNPFSVLMKDMLPYLMSFYLLRILGRHNILRGDVFFINFEI